MSFLMRKMFSTGYYNIVFALMSWIVNEFAYLITMHKYTIHETIIDVIKHLSFLCCLK